MSYSEDEYLQLSGLQHFAFCRRQWALIHIEQQWADNLRTVEGEAMHERAHNAALSESRGALYTARGMRVHSPTLGVSGECDIVEFRRSASGITIPEKAGLWQPYPVEYKHGEPKETDCDALQLCAQAMCLEEMLCCQIPVGALYYGRIKHRSEVFFSPELRENVQAAFAEMHTLFSRGYTPTVKPSKHCQACSLKELCLPVLHKKVPVESYLKKALEDKPCESC